MSRIVVVGAGLGGMSAAYELRDTLGKGHEITLVGKGEQFGFTPSNPWLAVGWRTRNPAAVASAPTLIEGIGRPRVEPSFIRTLVDRMVDVADCESVAAMRALSQLLGRRVGPSTGTNFVAMLTLASEMRERGERGSILSLLCDAGERYLPTYFDTDWVDRTFGDCSAAQQKVDALMG